MSAAPINAPSAGSSRGAVSAPLPHRYALLGNPNTGKTTLFNQLCGVRSKTANFPGSTVDARHGRCIRPGRSFEIIDLPGVYSLSLDLPESQLCAQCIDGQIPGRQAPQALVIVADATNLPRNLVFVLQALQRGLPSVVALNMTDLAQRRGLTIDADKLGARLGCAVVPIVARSGEGISALVEAMVEPKVSDVAMSLPNDSLQAAKWADEVVAESVGGDHAVGAAEDTFTDRLDAAFTHPLLGLLIFAGVMTGLFFTIFTLASIPMDLIDLVFTSLGDGIRAALPEGAIRDLLADGVVGGIAGTVVFLPQICLLFFLISLLEDTGYLARAAFVMDRFLRRFGLPGQAFVPLLSAHACAIPAIMSAKLIPDHRDRLATILVAPFMSCSARLPIYVLLIGVLFRDRPLLAGLAFTSCYILGAAAALFSAMLVRRTVLKGEARPMMLELPSYKLPSLRTALLTTLDHGMLFLRKAGTVIMAICIVLWWLSSYPHSPPPQQAVDLRASAASLAGVDAEQAAILIEQADVLESRSAMASSFIGRIGTAIEPAFRPLGYDWQLSIGVMTSFAAREVFVSTMAVIFAASDETDDPSVMSRIEGATRDDGTPVFTIAASASLLVFYVLALQCLSTMVITARETGSWKWMAVQFLYMSGLAYVAALLVYSGLRLYGVA